MADEPSKADKTEEATPRRHQEAREKGQVAFSTEFVAAGMLLAGLLLFVLGGQRLFGNAVGLVIDGAHSIGTLGVRELDGPDMAGLVGDAIRRVLTPLTLLVGPALLAGLLLGFGQAGFLISGKAVAFDLQKLDPVKGMGRMFGMRGVVRTLLALTKIIVIGVTVTTVAWLQMPRMAVLAGADLGPAMVGLWYVVLRCAIAALIVVLALGVVDMLYQRFQHQKDLRMSKQEVRDESKNIDGDPHVKARIRRIQREMAQRRMMQEVPEATVVVTNPTHYAVALRYAQDTDGGESRRAPVVVAKGADLIAQHIKQIARDSGVVCFEDVVLARALHARVEIGEEIPEDLYEAVASVLAYVYRVKGAAVPA